MLIPLRSLWEHAAPPPPPPAPRPAFATPRVVCVSWQGGTFRGRFSDSSSYDLGSVNPNTLRAQGFTVIFED